MSIHIPSPDAIRAKLWRERRKDGVAPDLKAILKRGREERAELEKHSRALCNLGRIEAAAAARLIKIQRSKNPWIRARMLGELADWIIARREALTEIVESRPLRVRTVRSHTTKRQVPPWVPDDLRAVYLDPTINEFEASTLVRQMKRENGAGA